MSRTKAGFTAMALIMSLGLITAPGVFAKAHDQSAASSAAREGPDTAPGVNVGSETVGSAQGLGAALGNGKGPSGSPGKSGDAGRPAGGNGPSGNSGPSGR